MYEIDQIPAFTIRTAFGSTLTVAGRSGTAWAMSRRQQLRETINSWLGRLRFSLLSGATARHISRSTTVSRAIRA
jgi:hypothetical protein